jgi:hypothetical protein
MKKITLDAPLRAKLNGLGEQLEVCDESGQTVGHFLPADGYRRLLSAAVEAACPFSTEELERRLRERGGRPLAEMWQRPGHPAGPILSGGGVPAQPQPTAPAAPAQQQTSHDGNRPPEPPDISNYHDNRCKFPLDELIPFAGKHVAWSPDGLRILASGADEAEVDRNLLAAGIHPSQAVYDYIDDL